MSTLLGQEPYSNPAATDMDDTSVGSPVLETPLIASQMTFDIGGTMMHAEVFDGAIPGPTLRLNVGDTVVVRLINVAFDYEVGFG